MMSDGSLLRSGGETWGPVSPEMFTKEVSRSIVAAKAEQFERTRGKTWSSSRSEVFVPYTPPCRPFSSVRLSNEGSRIGRAAHPWEQGGDAVLIKEVRNA